MNDSLAVFFLGVIALAVLAMAIGQVVAVWLAARAIGRLGETVARLQNDMRPIVANLHAISTDAARVVATATSQVQRAERLLDDVTRKVDGTMTAVQSFLGPARNGVAIVQGIKAAVSAFLDLSAQSRARRAATVAPVTVADPDPSADEDQASFIG